MEKKGIPEFASLNEMARFFDEHSAAELELEPEDLRYEPKRSVFSVRFDREDMIAIGRLSRRYGMDRSTFVRFVVKRFLRQATQHGEAPTRG